MAGAMAMEEQSQYTGAVLHMSSEDGRRLCITGMSLVDPAYVRDERVVNVWAEVGQEKRAIGTLSSRQPVVVFVPPVVLAGEFVLRHDLPVPAAVWLNVRVLCPPESPNVEEIEGVLVLGVDNEEDVVLAQEVDDDDGGGEEEAAMDMVGVEYEPMSEDDVAERYDSDNGEDDVGGGGVRARESSRKRRVAAPSASVVVPDGEFLGPAQFAVAGNTAGFMWIAATGENQESREIVVLYRYTRFSSSRSGRRGVEPCKRTKLHRLRFAVPSAAGELASSLAFAGSSLGALIYPGLFRQQLVDLWTSLLLATSPAGNNGIPPGVGRLQVIVDVGILRREDYTAERMADMRGELVRRVVEPWPAYCCCYHVGMELQLPEAVPANRRMRIAVDGEEEEEEECCLCFELMESGLAAWPGCGHVFHGACVEKTLQRSEMCPLCRHRLSDPLVRSTTR